MSELRDLMARYPRKGRVEWIGLRRERRGVVDSVPEAELTPGGLRGDHRKRPGKRAVTLIQAEHLPVIAALAGREALDPGALRRNIVVSGINLSTLKGRVLTIGAARVEITDACVPCSHMEAVLGEGGYNAMRGHGGMTAEVIEPGNIRVGDEVAVV